MHIIVTCELQIFAQLKQIVLINIVCLTSLCNWPQRKSVVFRDALTTFQLSSLPPHPPHLCLQSSVSCLAHYQSESVYQPQTILSHLTTIFNVVSRTLTIHRKISRPSLWPFSTMAVLLPGTPVLQVEYTHLSPHCKGEICTLSPHHHIDYHH